MLISGGQQSDSLVRIHAFLLCEVLFPYRLFQNIAQSSLYYTVGPCWSSILNIAMCIYSTPKLLLYVLLPTSFVRWSEYYISSTSVLPLCWNWASRIFFFLICRGKLVFSWQNTGNCLKILSFNIFIHYFKLWQICYCYILKGHF